MKVVNRLPSEFKKLENLLSDVAAFDKTKYLFQFVHILMNIVLKRCFM